jgi:hypothetical protein
VNPIAIHCRLIGAPLSVLCIDQKESCCWGNLYGLFLVHFSIFQTICVITITFLLFQTLKCFRDETADGWSNIGTFGVLLVKFN